MIKILNVKKILFVLLIAAASFSCTENVRAKRYGGTQEIKIEAGKHLVQATWKDNQLWYLTTSMDSGYTPKTYTFHEKSSFGVWEGNVIFQESK